MFPCIFSNVDFSLTETMSIGPTFYLTPSRSFKQLDTSSSRSLSVWASSPTSGNSPPVSRMCARFLFLLCYMAILT